MKVIINRCHKKWALIPDDKYIRSASEIWEKFNYRSVDIYDIENFDLIQWEGIEYNRLLKRNNILYKFVEWCGKYPYNGIIIEEIGIIENDNK